MIAGPGTGKTATLVEAIVERLTGDNATSADRVLGLTFGRKAAAEWRDRVIARVGGGAVPSIMTFHSFAYHLFSKYTDAEGAPPLRLLSGAEEEGALRTQIMGSVTEGYVQWPKELTEALGTYGLAREVRALFAKARECDISAEDLARLAVEHDRPEWTAAATFMQQYLDALALSGRIDYSELIVEAAGILADPQIGAEVRGQYDAIFVDEYQDTDPAQVALLKHLVTPATSLIVVGDPDQAIYTFRGADLHGILDFPNDFRTTDGSPAPTEVLNVTRRFGPTIREAATALMGTRAIPSMTERELHEHRHPSTTAQTQGTVNAVTFLTEAARADAIASQVRQWRAESGCAWSDIAVIVRAARHMGDIRRALNFADIPASMAPEDTLLHEEPAIAPLVLALDLISKRDDITGHDAQQLLTSWIGGADVADLRRLGRMLRNAFKAAHPGEPLPSSKQLIAHALMRPNDVLGLIDGELAGEVFRQVENTALLLAAAKAKLSVTPEEAAWVIWSGEAGKRRTHNHPENLRRRALTGGVDGRRADHDLDAMITFFEVMERSIDQRNGVLGMSDFLGELRIQAIPSEPFDDADGASDAVRILTAHRSKGLQWEHVIVVGAEEGVWPDVRPRSSVLGADSIRREGVVGPLRPYELLAEERRLFYVAMTRAKENLLITGLHSADESGDTVSRFVADAGLTPVPVQRRNITSLTPASLVAQLRAAASDPEIDEAVRDAAIARLAWLADHGEGEFATLADPQRWWFTKEWTTNDVPIAGNRVTISGSALEHMLSCGLKWFYERKANASVARGSAMSFGSVIHAIAEYVGKGELPADVDELDPRIDAVWDQMAFEAGWQKNNEREQARAAIERFVNLHNTVAGKIVATEQSFGGPIEIDGEQMILRGSIDRIQEDEAGLHLWDYKTGTSKPTGPELETYSQLGVYQKAIESGLAEGVARNVADASLVFLRLGEVLPTELKQPRPTGDPSWIDEQLVTAARVVRAEQYEPTVGRACSFCSFTASCPAASLELGQ